MEAIAEVFNEVQESTSVSQKQVYALLEQYESNKTLFIKAVEQCYLKIIKNMLKAPRKLIEKYEKLTEKLFETGYRQYALKEDASAVGGKKQKLTKRDIFQLFQHFLSFFAGALDSTQLQIRVFSSRIVFQLLKILPSDVLEDVIETKIAKQIILGTLSLMKEKKGNLKQIGIKITSYLQRLMDRNDLTDSQEAKVLRSEMMRSMCMDEQDQIRKLALINLEMNESTFPHLIKRIRDKNPEIRATVFKKLIKEQIPLANLNLSDVYKLIYDGLGSREIAVRDACTRYLSLNYCLFKEQPENIKPDENDMEIEEKGEEDGEEKVTQNEKKVPQKKFSAANKETALKEMKINIVNFLSTFEVEKSLYYPELYESLEALVKETIKCILDAEGFAGYLKEVFLNQLSLKKKKKHTKIELNSEELLLIRVACQMVQNPEDRKELSPEIVAVVEDCFPNGAEFSQVVEYYAYTAPSLFSLYQALLASELLINCDEAGRNKLEETLKNLVKSMNNQQLISEIPLDDAGEYNDIFYELDAENVKNSIFALAYFQPPIITCAYELLPIIVRIIKNVVSDGRANVQLIQLISEVHEPLAKDTDNDTHFDLPTELERIQKMIQDGEGKVESIEKELGLLKKNKTKQREIYELEKQKDDILAHLSMSKDKEEQIQIKIFDVSMRQLILVQALLTNCKVDPKDQSISNLLQQIIMPGLNSENDNLVAHALKALALYVLVDKNVCNDFFSVFQDLLSKNEGCTCSSPQEIISLRSIVDFILLYDLSHKGNPDEEEIDIINTQDLIMKYAYQAETLLRTIAIEGLSKLLFNGKLQDPQSTICLLMVIWFDTKICQREGFKAIQILSTLFKTYTASSYSNLVIFEKALELFSMLIVTLDKKALVFNDDYVLFDHQNEKFTSKALRVGINLLSYEYHKSTEALTNAPQVDLPPQERFFVYLAYKCTKDKRFLALFEKVTQFFDFYNRCQPEHLHILLYFLDETLQNCSLSKQLIAIDKLLKEKIKLAFQAEKLDEEIPKVNGAGEVAAANAQVEDEKLYELSAKQKKVCEKLVNYIESNSAEIDVIVKNLQESQIIVQDSQEQKEKRAKIDDEEEEEEVPEFAQDEEDQEKEEAKPRQRGGRGGKRKPPPINEVEEVQEVEKKNTRRGRKPKDIEEAVSEEEEEQQDEDAEEVIQKHTSSRRNQKFVEEKVPSRRGRKQQQQQEEEEEEQEQEQEEEQEEDEEQEEEQEVKQRGRKKKEPSNQKRSRSRKVQQAEQDEQVSISEEENQEEVEEKQKGRKKKETSSQKRSRSRKVQQVQEEDAISQEEEEEKIEVVVDVQKGNRRSQRRKQPQQDEEEEVEEEEVEELKPKRGKGNKLLTPEKPQRTRRRNQPEVEEEQEEEEEEEEQVVVKTPQRKTRSGQKQVQQSEEEEVVEVLPKRGSKRGKQSVNNSREEVKPTRSRGRNQKQALAEPSDESEQEEEEEDVPKNKRKAQKELPKPQKNALKTNSNKRSQRGKQIEVIATEDEEQEEEEEEQVNEAPQKKQRGKRSSSNPRRNNKKIEPEEQEEEEQEEEEDEQVQVPKRSTRRTAQEAPPQKQVSSGRRTRR